MGKTTRNKPLWAGLGLLLILCAAVLLNSNRDQAQPGKTTDRAAEAAVVDQPREANSHQTTAAGLNWGSIVTELRSANSRSQAQTQLQQLRDRLQAMSQADAVAAMEHFLNSGEDAPTGLPFKVGPNGFLTQAPALRVFLLDYLGQIDPAAAAKLARTILAAKDSPEEWAIALRNIAKFSPGQMEYNFLTQKVHELLAYEPWVSQPTAGFLEAFDVAVYLGGTHQLAALTALVRHKDNQPVAQAAYLALDRLVITDAPAVLAFLEGHPDLMLGREETRANYFARADVREEAQRQILERYLLNPELTAVELERFVGLYPNANFMVSHNLLTPVVTPDADWLQARDAEALRVVRQWEADPRFNRWKPQLATLKSRLEVIANPAANSP